MQLRALIKHVVVVVKLRQKVHPDSLVSHRGLGLRRHLGT